jgi:hypothetical protein
MWRAEVSAQLPLLQRVYYIALLVLLPPMLLLLLAARSSPACWFT